MDKFSITRIRVTELLDPSTGKRFSIITTIIALIGVIIGYFLIWESQPFISLLFLVAMAYAAILILLFLLNLYMLGLQFAIIALWVLFSFIGISQGDINSIMVTGFLMLTMISSYAFHLKGVIRLVLASMIVLVVTGWMDANGLSFYRVEPLAPIAKVIVSLLFLLVGGSYLVTTLDVLGKNYLQVREFQRRYLALFNDSIDVIVIINLENKILDMNPIGLELTGYTLEEIRQMILDELVIHEGQLGAILDDLRHARKVGSFEHQIRAKNGELVDVESIPTTVTDEDGIPLYIQVHMRDVRSRKLVENYLTEFKQRYEAMFERAEYGFLLLDMDLEIVAANHQAANILKCQLPDLHNHPIKQVLNESSFKQLLNDIERLKQTGELPPRQYRLITQKENILWVEANIGLVDTNGDQPQYVQWVMRDVTEQKHREKHLLNALQEMETLAMTDPLTGVHNRRSIQHYAQIELENCSLESKPFCLILIDMDELKKINDTLGHQTGDLALSQCAELLTLGKRRQDAVGRWGGDEFLMVLPDTSLHDAEIVAHRIVSKINKVQIGQGNSAKPLAVSMGIAGLESCLDDDNPDFERLVELADRSMYHAKDRKGSRVNVAIQDKHKFLP